MGSVKLKQSGDTPLRKKITKNYKHKIRYSGLEVACANEGHEAYVFYLKHTGILPSEDWILGVGQQIESTSQEI